MHLIDKDEAVSRIKRRIDEINDRTASYPSDSEHDYLCRIEEGAYKNSIHIINSLEVKEVDLEKEVMRYLREIYDRDTTVKDVAKHFFKFGLKTQKGE